MPDTERPEQYNPSTCSPIRTSYDGPHKRPIPHEDGVWYRKFQSWTDAQGREVGAWCWTREAL